MKWILLVLTLLVNPLHAAQQYTAAECILLKQQVDDYNYRLGKKSPLSIKSKSSFSVHCKTPIEAKSNKSAFLTNPKVKNSNVVISSKNNKVISSPKVIQTQETTSASSPFSLLASMLMPMFLILFFGMMAIYYLKKKLPEIKGRIGENYVRKGLLKYLDEANYTIINDVTLPLEDGGTTQIDHIVVSSFGLFVIETKNMSGWIFGSEHQVKWTQTIHRSKHQFQNPLRQNYKHTKTLAHLLNMPHEKFHSVVVFTPNAELKTKMPNNVGYLKETMVYIKSFQKEVSDNQTKLDIINLVQSIKLKQGRKTDKQHLKYLKEEHRRKFPA